MRSQFVSPLRDGNWRRIYRILTSETLLSSVDVSCAGRIGCHALTWEDYWANVVVPRSLEPYLDDLRFAWAGYIKSGFDFHLTPPYCYAYFTALHRALDGIEDGSVELQVLKAILGFENAAVNFWEDQTGEAALTSTARNPVYLLSKIRTPAACEDSKFLPIITYFDPTRTAEATSPLFYHYRQLSSGEAGQSRILIFPPVAMSDRLAAFLCIHALSNAFSGNRDTRVKQRSTRIAELAIGPILDNLLSSGMVAPGSDIRVADLGAGSGDLTRQIITRLGVRHSELFQRHRLSWTLVDVSLSGLQRHAFNRRFSQWLSQLRCKRLDYIRWTELQRQSGDCKPFHLILACRLLNNTSLFSIGCATDWQEVSRLVGKGLEYFEWIEGAYLPDVALRCGKLGSDRLMASNAKVSLPNGFSYRQASLSDYFRGLHILAGEKRIESKPSQHPVFFPIRKFNESAIIMSNGSTLLERLCSLSSAVVIEDVDLDAAALRRLLQRHGLQNLAASDATNRSRMHSANLLCIAERHEESILPGRRIW